MISSTRLTAPWLLSMLVLMSTSVMWILNPRVRIECQSRTGANPSAEEEQDTLEEGSVQVNNVVTSFRLQSTPFDKKSYLTYLKTYMKTVKEKLKENNPGRVELFERGAAGYAKKIVANFKNFEFYTGESMSPEGMVALLDYRVS